MIFPQERISQLEHDVNVKRAAFFASQDRFLGNARQQITPMVIFKGGALGALFGLASFFFAGRFLAGGGLFSKLLKTGALVGVRALTPVIRPLLSSLFKNLLKKFN